jgi:hypothetical protein
MSPRWGSTPLLFPPQDLYISPTSLPSYTQPEDGEKQVLRNFGTATTREFAKSQGSIQWTALQNMRIGRCAPQ